VSFIQADQEEVGDAAYNTSLSYDQKQVLHKAKDVLLRDLKTIENFNVGHLYSRSYPLKKPKRVRTPK
jgi:hypothetical protein